ncbi:MAG TPA: hypothetical protein VGG64_03715 [Pirellulales bacterium]|jgi:hypothetical protein
MEYHAELTYGNGISEYLRNRAKDEIVTTVLVPFLARQVVWLKLDSREMLVNMATMMSVVVYRSESRVAESELRDPGYIKYLPKSAENCTRELMSEIRADISSPRVKSFLELSFAPINDRAFVIMRFRDPELDSAYKGVVKPLFEARGLAVTRVDEVQDSGKVDDQILELIATSRFVFAELSGERPNCYYETGFAHALGKELILAIRKKERKHFDLAAYRFIEWTTEHDLREQLSSRLKNIEAPTTK